MAISGNFLRVFASDPMSSFSGVQPEESGRPASSMTPSSDSIRIDDPAAIAAHGAELFKLAQLGDRGAFAQIVQLYQDRLYNAILRMVGDYDEARDLAQECFARALEKIDSFRGEAQPYTWLFRIAMNLAISQFRKEKRQRTFTESDNGRPGSANDSDDQAASLIERVSSNRQASADPAQQAEDRERNEQVLAALGRIDAEHRAILVMRDVEGFDYQQMADVLGLPLGTLKSRLFRARIALRDELKPYIEGNR
jgi:RNA polymerase sigma-70 factor (ECF subfamily)